jgi:hypothetical protein
MSAPPPLSRSQLANSRAADGVAVPVVMPAVMGDGLKPLTMR